MELESAKASLLRSIGLEVHDERVLAAMAKVSRELFIPQEYRAFAYDDRPLSIGFGQTISQPMIVAMMTHALELKGDENVLELGTGSGYQTAILCQLAKHVTTVERIKELTAKAQEILSQTSCTNVEFHVAGKKIGWESGKPYDAIIVTASTPSVPAVLVQQLKVGGRMVIPVGSKWDQELLKVTRLEKGHDIQHLGFCRFVPLIGEEAWGNEE